MKSDYPIKRLGDVCSFFKGKKPHSFLAKGGIPYLTAKVIRKTEEPKFTSDSDPSAVWVKREDIVIIMDGSNSGEMFTGLEGALASTMGIINYPEDLFDPRYLLHFLITHREKFTKSRTGAAIPHLNKEEFDALEIPTPPLPEQQRIVKILDEVFEKTDKAKENTQKNLQKAKDVFEAYQNNIFTVQNNNWENKKLGECFKLKSGDNITSKMMDDNEKYPVYGGNGIAGKYKNFNLSGSNIIVGRVGALCGNVRHISEEVWLTDNGFKIVDFKFDFDHDFLTYLLNYKNLRRYARQAAQPVISNSSLESVLLHFPMSLAEQKSIVLRLISISNNIKKLESVYHQKLIGLDKLKKSILNKAFSGEL